MKGDLTHAIADVHAAFAAMGADGFARRVLGAERVNGGNRDRARTACPIHGGSKPNLSLDLKDGRILWHCWSDCGAGGDAIELVARLRGLDGAHFRDQLAAAAEAAGVSVDLEPGSIDRAEQQRRKAAAERQRAEQEAERRRKAADELAERSAIFGALVDSLELHGPAIPWLRKRGLVHPVDGYAAAVEAGVVCATLEAVEGWPAVDDVEAGPLSAVPGALAVVDDAHNRRRVRHYGLTHERLTGPHLTGSGAGRLIFPMREPVIDGDGSVTGTRVVWLGIRDLDPNAPKDRRWDSPKAHDAPGAGHSLFGADLLPTAPRDAWIVLCEGPVDWLTLRVWRREVEAEYGPFVPLGKQGTGTLTPRQAAMLEGRRVVVAYDQDDAGQRGVEALCDELRTLGVEVESMKRWSLPPKQDLNDYLPAKFKRDVEAA